MVKTGALGGMDGGRVNDKIIISSVLTLTMTLLRQ